MMALAAILAAVTLKAGFAQIPYPHPHPPGLEPGDLFDQGHIMSIEEALGGTLRSADEFVKNGAGQSQLLASVEATSEVGVAILPEPGAIVYAAILLIFACGCRRRWHRRVLSEA
jgi:hypothetical protein